MFRPIFIAVTVVAFLAASATCAEMHKELEVLAGGKTQIDRGPKLNLVQLKAELQRLSKMRPRPKIVLFPDRGAKFDDVAAVLKQAQETGFRIGFVVGPKAQ